MKPPWWCVLPWWLAVAGGSWMLMMGFHELGHVLGAWVSGAVVDQVVWAPWTISRTDVSENTSPLLVVWAGPAMGCLLPALVDVLQDRRSNLVAQLSQFLAGFCWIANGAYLAIGSLDAVGDTGTMLRHGSPVWTLWLAGGLAAAIGLWRWHRLGAVGEWLSAVDTLPRWSGWAALGAVGLCSLAVGVLFPGP